MIWRYNMKRILTLTLALAMALSGMALTVAGAFTSLFAKSKH